MTDNQTSGLQRPAKRDGLFGNAMLMGGLAIAGLAFMQINSPHAAMAQAGSQTGSDVTNSDIAPAKPGGTRPTTPAPEPAQPQSAPGANPAATTGIGGSPTTQDRPPETGKPLPPAPAEQIAPPMK